MRKSLLKIGLGILLCSCTFMQQDSDLLQVNQNTLSTRIETPSGYKRIEVEKSSFGGFIRDLEVKPDQSPILDYQGNQIMNQSSHLAIINLDVGKKDLQQCADACIRIRAEYLWNRNEKDALSFQLTNGQKVHWKEWSEGMRPHLKNNKITFSKDSEKDESKANFRKWLDFVYTYAGTISLSKQLHPTNELSIGDIIVTPGSPGHVVMIADIAENSRHERIYLLLEGYTPAQSIHVLTGESALGNAWQHITVGSDLETARYSFHNPKYLTWPTQP